MGSIQDPLRFANLALEDEASEDIPLHADTAPEKAVASVEPLQEPLSASQPALSPRLSEPLGAVSNSRGHLLSTSSNNSNGHSTASGAYPSSSHNRMVSNASATTDPLSMSMLDNVDLGPSEIDSGAVATGSAVEAAGPSHRAPPAVHITISDPVKRVSDHSYIPVLTSTHYEYLVTSIPSADAPGGPEAWPRAEVRRRFSDFVALSDLLAVTQRGYFVFPRPDKGALEGTASGRTEAEFVEGRRIDLERYLNRLAQHPVIGRSEEFRVFLTAEGSLASSFPWQQLQPLKGSLMEGVARLPRQLLGAESAVPTTTDAQKNARHTNDLFRRLKELGERMRQEYQAPTELPDEEVGLRETRAGVESYAESLSTASRRAEKVLREFERLGAATGDVGLALIRLAKYEDEVGSTSGAYSDIGFSARALAADARRVGMAAVRVCRLSRATTSESMAALEPLHTELALAPAVVDALKEREAALLTVNSIREDMMKKQAALVMVEGSGEMTLGDPSKVKKAQALRNEIAALEAAVEAATAEYDKVKHRNQDELARWREEREGEFLRMAKAYAQVSAVYYEQGEEVWRGVAEDLRAGGQAREPGALHEG